MSETVLQVYFAVCFIVDSSLWLDVVFSPEDEVHALEVEHHCVSPEFRVVDLLLQQLEVITVSYRFELFLDLPQVAHLQLCFSAGFDQFEQTLHCGDVLDEMLPLYVVKELVRKLHERAVLRPI